MKKIQTGKRMLSVLLAVVFLFLQVFAGTMEASAASYVELDTINLLKHGDFEDTSIDLKPHQDPYQLDYWYVFPTGVTKPVKVNDNAHTGEWAVKLSATEDAVEQDVADLKEGATYIATVWAKATSPETSTAYFGVKNYGGSEIKVRIDSSEYKQYTIPFTYTGVSGKYPRIYVWVESMSSGEIYVDDFSLTMDSDLQSLNIENGRLTAAYKADYTGAPNAADFTAVYRSSLAPDDIKPLALTQAASEGTKLDMIFEPITPQPVEQTITVDVTYVPENQTITLDYPVEASGEPVIFAGIEQLQAENGTLTAVLDCVPTVAPKEDDFTVEYAIDNGEWQELDISGFAYDASERTVTLGFNRLPSALEEQNVTIKVIYRGEESEASFAIHAAEGVTYYVAADGSDENDGMSEDTPFQSIDKLNTITFNPGDQILFKKGDTFQGAFKPQGSGIEGMPIVVASYGDEDAAKPVLMPSEENWKSYVMTADTSGRDYVTVNNGITFYNQSYWEVRDLELYDPDTTGEPNQSVYNRGINITGMDAGELKHFYFDNLTIHGFHGPNSNIGKSSGGILMEVQSVAGEPASEHIPTSINDIRITNCELYDLGRSGVNFVTVWARRAETADTKWGPYPSNHGTNWPGYTRTAYKNFYLANNYIHNIDGDGCIVDTCDDAVVEHNLVYRCEENAPMAVGLFNWNSDNTVFQFNEVYDTQRGGDAQGIEIDALNDTTYVQYNYLHDNAGGSIMWCNTAGLYGFDGVFRYNIFQNDDMEHGLLDMRTGCFNGQCYNNTFYMKSDGYKNFTTGAGGISDVSFYNNIFYYPGDVPFEANDFKEDNIDWEANLFYNFANVPSNDNSVVTEDPLFADPGKGGTGSYPGDVVDLSGYALQEGSPAIDAGIPIGNNGGRDYFGNPVSGLPDIGAYDSGSVSLRLGSSVYTIDQEMKTVSIPDSGSLAVRDIMSSLIYDDSVSAAVYRGGEELEGDQEIKDGDVVGLRLDGQEAAYTIVIVHDPELLYLTSDVYTIDQEGQTIALPEGSATTVDSLLAGLEHREGVSVQVKRGEHVLAGDEEVSIGDSVAVSKGEYRMIYVMTVSHDASSDEHDIPVSLLSAAAGSEEPYQGLPNEGPAYLALDGNANTIWHSKWDGDDRENLYITINLSEDYTYVVDGLRYLPRTAGGTNGMITTYKIQYSTDGVNFEDVPGGTGTWGQTGWQDVQFAPVEAKAVRLYAVDSMTQVAGTIFATAAEIRLTGTEKADDIEPPAAPEDVMAETESLTETSAVIRWEAPADADVAGYRIKVDDGSAEKLYYAADPRITFQNLTDLKENTEYTVRVAAVDTAGNSSEEAEGTFRTLGAPAADISTAVLEYALELAESASTEGVVDAVVEKFEAAKADARALLDAVAAGDASVTQKQIDDSWRELMNIMSYLSFKQGDKTDLEKVIAFAEEIEGKLDSYIENGKQEFEDALAEARRVYEDGNAMQDETDQAWKTLLNAMADLRLKAEKGALEELVNKAADMDLSAYTEESARAFSAALAEAQSILADESLSEDDQSVVDEAVQKLAEAQAALVMKEDAGNTSGSGETGEAQMSGKDNGGQQAAGNDGSGSGTSGKTDAASSSGKTYKAVKTGDTVSAGWLVLMALAAVLSGSAVMMRSKRR